MSTTPDEHDPTTEHDPVDPPAPPLAWAYENAPVGESDQGLEPPAPPLPPPPPAPSPASSSGGSRWPSEPLPPSSPEAPTWSTTRPEVRWGAASEPSSVTDGLDRPVGPESPTPEPTPVTAPSSPRWVIPLVVLAAVAIFAGGALAGWAISEQTGTDADQSAAPQVRETTPVGDGGEGGLVPDDAVEPVAAVAQAVAPSVVQIDTNFGLGSGIVMDDQGNILTAAHVIEGATEVRVRLADGTMVPAEIVGTHPETDVGVVSVEPRPELIPAVLGVNVEVQVGQLAVAVGSPFGLQQTVTSGIVSALDRPVETAPTFRVGMIQTDASINPGNSGGALADRHGRVIGINDAIRTQGGGNEGVGFAIPIDLAASVAERLIAGEPIQSGFLGVSAGSPMEGRPGALVQEVTSGTPAEEAGIEVEDLIVAIEGEPVRGVQELRARILALDPGTPVIVTVVRGGEELDLEVVLTVSQPSPVTP